MRHLLNRCANEIKVAINEELRKSKMISKSKETTILTHSNQSGSSIKKKSNKNHKHLMSCLHSFIAM